MVFSNEASSSYGNLRWGPYEVNHQWSKGLEFEELLRGNLVGTGVEYVSLLRPLTELAIMRRFATETAYHSAFTSCNRAFHLDESRRRSWCGTCPKCQFVFLHAGAVHDAVGAAGDLRAGRARRTPTTGRACST